MKTQLLKWYPTLILSSVLLSACGGSSSSPTPPVVPPPVNVSPIANGGAEQTVKTQTEVTLQGTASDTDGTIATIEWQQFLGPAVVLQDFDNLTAHFISPPLANDSERVLSFQLTVTDNLGATAQSSTDIIVKGNQTPLVSAGADQSISQQPTVTLSGQASDADGHIASAQWLQTEGPAVELQDADTLTASFATPVVHEVTLLRFELTAIDDSSTSVQDSVEVTLTELFHINNPQNALIGHLNQDGLPDLVSYDLHDIVWYATTTAGSFAHPLTVGNSEQDINVVKVADVNFDGFDDIVYTTSGGIHWLENQQDNSFAAAALLMTDWSDETLVCLPTTQNATQLLDVDNDGILDISWVAFCNEFPDSHPNSQRLYYAKGNADRLFSSPHELKSYPSGGMTFPSGYDFEFKTLDLNNDGSNNLVFKVNTYSGGGDVFVGNHAVSVYTATGQTIAPSYHHNFIINDDMLGESWFVDLNNDNLPELVGHDIADFSSWPYPFEQQSFSNLGDFAFADAAVLSPELTFDDSADINENGLIDLLSYNTSTHAVSWQPRTADGFNPSQVLFAPTTVVEKRLQQDWDGDGDLDFLLLTPEGYVSWYQNLGDGIFSLGQ